MLIAGTSGIGKSTLATALTERFTEKDFQFCVFDPEGDYDGLENAVVVGDGEVAPIKEQALQLMEQGDTNVVVSTLALGLDAGAAFAPHLRVALRTALIPPIDSTKVVGLISLPGATVGLLLAGVNPLTAIRYQVVVMYMLLGAAAVAGVVAGRMSLRALFDDAHRLRT